MAIIWLGVFGAGAIAWFAYDLPDIGDLATPARRPSVTLVAADGASFASFGDLYGRPVTAGALPPHLPWAVLAAEDRRFYEHSGLDVIGLARATLVNLREGGIRQGGSTLTQQLAKNLFLTPERTFDRKIREAILALQLEQRFTKDEILTIYLNRVYLGAGAWGIDAAARRYFGKPAAKLTLYESAMIAGLLKAPSRYNPRRDPELAHRRAVLVLDAMVDAGFIKGATARKAKRLRREGPVLPAGTDDRFFADWVLDRVRGYVGYTDRDLIVTTTLQPRLQQVAARQAGALLKQESARTRARQVALVSMAPDGAIRAMLGGRDYRSSQFNRATQALRQPGSVFKPVIYLTALEAGYRPDSRFHDGPVKVGKWRPRNFKGKYYGDVTMREAVTRSLNSVAVRASEKLGRGRVIDTARRLGITAKLRADASIALGASEVSLLEMTAAYAVFANGGAGVWPYGIVEIRDSGGHVLFRRQKSGPGQVVDKTYVSDMNDLLGAVVAWGTGRNARIDRPAAGKTGTSQDFRDAWFIGYTPDLVTGVWIGNDDGTPMNEVTGGGLPARLWRGFMRDALRGTPARPLPGVVAAKR
ncbi:MAG: PBP1A family penicillin-binding protein [Alphaproteobacteria bacterium]|nr:PBP1A family penicillin-binding protein [Alphaproteobacteria bacterium]